MKKHSENKAKKGYIEVRDKNDLLSELFGYASMKQAVANHKKLTK